jgi:hypothetical protein
MAKNYKELISSTEKVVNWNKFDTKPFEEFQKKNKDVIDDIHTIAKSYAEYKEKHILPKKLKGIKNYIMYKGDRTVYLKNSPKEKWKTNTKSVLTMILTDLVYSKIFNLDFSVYSRYIKDPNKNEVSAQDFQDTSDVNYDPAYDASHTSVDENQALIDFCFSSSELKYNLWQQIWDLVAVWEWFAYVDMQNSEARIEYNKELWKLQSEWIDKKEAKAQMDSKAFFIPKSNAVYNYIPYSNVIYEFDKDFYKSSFVWVFSFEDLDVFLSEHPFINMTTADKHFVLNSKRTIYWKDFNRVKMLSDFESTILWSCDNTNLNSQNDIGNNITIAEWRIISYETEVNKKIGEVYKHWTNETLTIFFNGHLIYDGANPIQWHIPIVRMNKMNIGGCTTSQWTTETLIDIQTSFDLISNSADDSLKLTLANLFYTKWYANIEWVWDYIPVWDTGRIFKWDVDSIQRLELGKFDYNTLKMMDHYRQQGVMSVWLNNTSSFWDGSAQQTTWNFNKLYNLSLDVLRQAIFSIWFWLTKAYKIWSIKALTTLPPKIKTTVTWDDGTAKDIEIKLANIVSDSEIVYQPLSINDYQFQNLVNNFTLFSNFTAANWVDKTNGVVNYDNGAIIKQFWKAVGLKWFYQTDDEYFEKRKAAITKEYELEEYKMQRQKELQEKYSPQNNTPTNWNTVNNWWWEAPVYQPSTWLISSIFSPPKEVAVDE